MISFCTQVCYAVANSDSKHRVSGGRNAVCLTAEPQTSSTVQSTECAETCTIFRGGDVYRTAEWNILCYPVKEADLGRSFPPVEGTKVCLIP